jgi:hypothetical protein
LAALLSCPGQAQPAAQPAEHFTLGNLEIGEPLAEARSAFTAAGSRIVRVTNVPFRQPNFEADNLINDRGEIYGNISICNGRITGIVLYLTSYDQLMQVLRQRIAQLGQPEISFAMVEGAEGSRADEDIRFSWPRLHFEISFPASSGAVGLGAQALSDGARCERP